MTQLKISQYVSLPLLQVKVEGLSKAALIKSLSPRVMLSNHLLPKGTKMKVNLEDQGRQKVSFSFAQTKRPLQNRFFIPSEKPATEAPPPSLKTDSDKEEEADVEYRADQKLTPVVMLSAVETQCQAAASQATKLKTDLTKMHFKKQILSVSVTEDQPTSVVPEEPSSSSSQDLQNSTCTAVPEIPTPSLQSDLTVCPSESIDSEASVTRGAPSPKKPNASSGKDGDGSSSAEQDNDGSSRKTRSQSKSAAPGSESDGDSAHTSCKSTDSKRKTSSDSRSKETKKSSFDSHVEEKEKSSSKRSENHERASSYSKSDRESRHTSSRSSRSDRDHRRTRSRSRSRSRGSRMSLSYSRSDRSRGDRGSRSERLYYHDSERRTHRSSPRRDRRRSRSRTERTRDSSDSEDDHRRTRTRASESSRSSTHSSSLKDSKPSSFSKSEKGYKSSDPSESDKRTQSLRCERTSKRPSDSDPQRKSSSYHKSSSNRLSSSSGYSHPEACEKRPKSSSSDSEADHRAKSQASDKRSGSEESNGNAQNKEGGSVLKTGTPSHSSEHDRQSDGVFHSPDKELCPSAAESCSVKMEMSDSEQSGSEGSNHQTAEEAVSSTEKAADDSSPRTEGIINSVLQVENENVNITSSESAAQEKPSSEDFDEMEVGLSSVHQAHANLSGLDFKLCTTDVVASVHGPTSIPDAQDPQEASNVDAALGTNVVLGFESSRLESESRAALKQPNLEEVKKISGATRKSRWDIVGQDTSDGDGPQRCAESKPAVKKVISVKKIEFSKDNPIQQDCVIKDALHEDPDTHSRRAKRAASSERMSLTDKSSDQSETWREGGEARMTGGDPLPDMADKMQVASAEKLQVLVQGAATNKRAVPSCGADGGQSEASDSDNSEYDSDCGEAIKRLHSVVVVPKNSSLTLDAQETGSSPCTPNNNNNRPELQNANMAVVRKQRQEELPRAEYLQSSANMLICQSQSNMIDSTSHSEGSSSVSAQPCVAGHAGSHESATYGFRQQGHTQHVNIRSEVAYSPYKPAHFSDPDQIGTKQEFHQSWDFPQSEQPSSTYPQPDSSHGPQLPATAKVAEMSLKHQQLQQELTQASATWNHQSANVPTSGDGFHHEHHENPASEIHPDSLTSDHDDYGADKLGRGKAAADCVAPDGAAGGFVQGHEISSNSRSTVVPDPPREDNFRPHRGRGPPKKRRPEVESDSDNEAEAGPPDKRERRGDDVPKESHAKAEAYHQSLALQDFQDANKWKELSKSKKMPPYFDLIEENLYLTER